MLFLTNIKAQKNFISAGLGHSYYINKNAGGCAVQLLLGREWVKNSGFEIHLGHSFNDVTTLPKNLDEAKILLKDETHRLPFGFGISGWEDDKTWPGISLRTQPDRYYRFDVGLQYFKNFDIREKYSYRFVAGLVMSYRDEMEIIKLLPTRSIEDFSIIPQYDHFLPITIYNTYYDLGVQAGTSFQYHVTEKIGLRYNVQFYYYPITSDFMTNNVLSFVIKR